MNDVLNCFVRLNVIILV